MKQLSEYQTGGDHEVQAGMRARHCLSSPQRRSTLRLQTYTVATTLGSTHAYPHRLEQREWCGHSVGRRGHCCERAERLWNPSGRPTCVCDDVDGGITVQVKSLTGSRLSAKISQGPIWLAEGPDRSEERRV